MNKPIIYLFKSIFILLLCTCIYSCSSKGNEMVSEIVKVSLRDVGHKILLANQDSTSLVKPIIALDANKYQLSFQEHVTIHPDSLVAIIKSSFEKADLPPFYITEVLNCEDKEVAYSYAINKNIEKGIVPCSGRELKNGCYLITIKFSEMPKVAQTNSKLIYIIGLGVLLLLVFVFYKRKTNSSTKVQDENYASIGGFKFYPDQNKLVKQAVEISLSKKECDLLELFAAQPNQIIKRDELMKKVWEDNGVIVGRSLDTYVSKLRKKLQDDASIKITNIHGVGYKLEVGR